MYDSFIAKISIPFLLMTAGHIVVWFKNNSKDLFDVSLSPFEWWIFTGLATNYFFLKSWWMLRENYDVWQTGIFGTATFALTSFLLNAYFYQVNFKQFLAFTLCVIACIIANS